jgi:hypothetical protein
VSLEKIIAKNKKKPVVEFSQKIMDYLHQNPLYKYTADEINESAYPKESCVFCGIYGCDKKISGYFAHNKCLEWVFKEVKKQNFKFKK